MARHKIIFAASQTNVSALLHDILEDTFDCEVNDQTPYPVSSPIGELSDFTGANVIVLITDDSDGENYAGIYKEWREVLPQTPIVWFDTDPVKPSYGGLFGSPWPGVTWCGAPMPGEDEQSFRAKRPFYILIATIKNAIGIY